MVQNIPDITSLIPQRFPMLMVDRLIQGDANEAVTEHLVGDGSVLESHNELREAGIMEHQAQSTAAQMGYVDFLNGAEKPRIGLLGEIKKFVCHRLPAFGEVIRTTVTVKMSFGNVSTVKCVTRVGDEVIAESRIKVIIQE